MQYIVIDIGCIECGESSGIVGRYGTIEEATGVADTSPNFTNGQHAYMVIDLVKTEVVYMD